MFPALLTKQWCLKENCKDRKPSLKICKLFSVSFFRGKHAEFSGKHQNCLICFNIWKYSVSTLHISWIFLKHIEGVFKCIKFCQHDSVVISQLAHIPLLLKCPLYIQGSMRIPMSTISPKVINTPDSKLLSSKCTTDTGELACT